MPMLGSSDNYRIHILNLKQFTDIFLALGRVTTYFRDVSDAFLHGTPIHVTNISHFTPFFSSKTACKCVSSRIHSNSTHPYFIVGTHDILVTLCTEAG